MIVLDANVLSAIFRPKPASQVLAWLTELPCTTIFATHP